MLLDHWPTHKGSSDAEAASARDGGLPGHASRGEHLPGDSERTVVKEPEFPVYLALKMFRCERALRKRAPGEGPDPFCFTVRRAHHLLVRCPGGAQVPELFQVSSYFLRERLKALNHGSVLQSGSRGMRNAVTYNWREPLGRSELDAYRRLVSIMDGDVRYALDLYRIENAVGAGSFTESQYLQLMGRWRSRTLGRSSQGTGLHGKGIAFRSYLRGRLHVLVRLRLVEHQGGRFRLAPAGRQATQWFDLFVHSVDYAGGGS